MKLIVALAAILAACQTGDNEKTERLEAARKKAVEQQYYDEADRLRREQDIRDTWLRLEQDREPRIKAELANAEQDINEELKVSKGFIDLRDLKERDTYKVKIKPGETITIQVLAPVRGHWLWFRNPKDSLKIHPQRVIRLPRNINNPKIMNPFRSTGTTPPQIPIGVESPVLKDDGITDVMNVGMPRMDEHNVGSGDFAYDIYFEDAGARDPFYGSIPARGAASAYAQFRINNPTKIPVTFEVTRYRTNPSLSY
ncbi:MAG: hypothetical protein AAB588_03080 [Patescibacteria group bacterium]